MIWRSSELHRKKWYSIGFTTLWLLVAALAFAQAPSPSLPLKPGEVAQGPVEDAVVRALCAFIGALFADVLGLAAAWRAGDVTPARWKQPRNYAGHLIYGALAAIVTLLFPQVFSTRLLAFVAGSKLPDIAEQLAQLATPKSSQAATQGLRAAVNAGAPAPPGPMPAPIRVSPIEDWRRFVARQV